MAEKKVYRSRTDRVILGVAGGLGRYFNIDPTIVRIVFVLLALGGGGGVILYLVLPLIIPEEPKKETEEQEEKTVKKKRNKDDKRVNLRSNWLGGVLVIVGAVTLWNELMPLKIRSELFLPVALITAGVYVLSKR